MGAEGSKASGAVGQEEVSAVNRSFFIAGSLISPSLNELIGAHTALSNNVLRFRFPEEGGEASKLDAEDMASMEL